MKPSRQLRKAYSHYRKMLRLFNNSEQWRAIQLNSIRVKEAKAICLRLSKTV